MTSLKDFIETGMAFFQGNLVSKKAVEEVEAKLRVAEQSLADLKATIQGHAGEIQNATDTVAKSQSRIAELEASLKAKDEEISGLRSEAKALKEAQTTTASEAARIARASGLPEKEAAAVAGGAAAAANVGSLSEQLASIKDPKAAAEFRTKHYQALMNEALGKKK